MTHPVNEPTDPTRVAAEPQRAGMTCTCDLSGDPDAKFISRITRLEESNRKLGEQIERQRAVIAERDAEIVRLTGALQAAQDQVLHRRYHEKRTTGETSDFLDRLQLRLDLALNGKAVPDDR